MSEEVIVLNGKRYRLVEDDHKHDEPKKDLPEELSAETTSDIADEANEVRSESEEQESESPLLAPRSVPMVEAQRAEPRLTKVGIIEEDGKRIYEYKRPRLTKDNKVKYSIIRRVYIPHPRTLSRKDRSYSLINKLKSDKEFNELDMDGKYMLYCDEMKHACLKPYVYRTFLQQYGGNES